MRGDTPTTLRIALLTAAVTVVAACAAEAPIPVATVRDSAGVEIVEHMTAPTSLAAWSLAATPEAVIGTQAGDEPAHQLTQVRGAVRLSDGRIVVGDWGSKEARYFDARGEHLLTVGGAGGGPGEVRFLYNVDRLHGDTMVIGGWPIGSRYWFDEGGSHVQNQALGPWYPGMLGRTLPDGSLVLDTYEFGSYGNTLENWAAFGPDEDIRPEGLVEIVSRDGERVDTLGTIRGEWHHKTGELRVNFAMNALPYSPIGLVTWSTELIFIGHTEEPEIFAYSYEGELQRVIRWTAGPVAATRADRMTFEDELISGLRRPDQAPYYRRWLTEISFPEAKPPWSAMIADEQGNLWVRPSTLTDATEVEWTVYGPDGTASALVTVPNHLTLLDVDASHAIVTWKDELDVEYVASYRIAR